MLQKCLKIVEIPFSFFGNLLNDQRINIVYAKKPVMEKRSRICSIISRNSSLPRIKNIQIISGPDENRSKGVA